MPIKINGEIYYRTAEVCMAVGIAKTTLYRWMREKVINEAEYRDRKGWRLFTESEIDRLKVEANRIKKYRIADNREIPRFQNAGKNDGQKQTHIDGKYFSEVFMK